MSTRDSQTIAQSSDANLSRRTQSKIERDPGTGALRKATTIGMTSPNLITDSANLLGIFKVGDIIDVRGSSLNSRRWYVTAVAAGQLTVLPAIVRTEAAGAEMTIIRES